MLPIGKLFYIEKGALQSTKSTPGDYDFITAAEEWKTHNEYTHECEALIFAAAASGSLGRTHYVDGKFTTSDLCYILTPKNDEKYPLNLSFYHFVFNSLRPSLVAATKSGTSKESINQTNFKNYEIPYFDIKLQDFWIEKLKNTLGLKGLLGSELTRQQDLLKKLRQQILQEAIEGKLTADWREQNPDVEPASELLKRIAAEKAQLVKDKKIKAQKPLPPITHEEKPFELPQRWKWCRLEEAGLFERGKSKHRPRNDPRLFESGHYPFVQTGDVARSKKNGFKISTFSQRYNDFGLAQSRAWGKGTLCITIAANIAETGFLDLDACFPDSVVGFTSISGLTDPFYVKCFIDATREEIEKFAPATAQKNINLGIINMLSFPLPPLEEQKVIVTKVKKLFALCGQLETQITQNQAHAEQLMQAVLKEAFSNNSEVAPPAKMGKASADTPEAAGA
jgi:restriction endonuclease S subunit